MLIFEDDIEIPSDFDERLSKCLEDLPENWDALWLCGTEQVQSVFFTPNLMRTRGMWGAFGYVVRNTLYDFLIEKLSEEQMPCDGYYVKYQKDLQCFNTNPNLIFHKAGVSTIRNKYVDYKHLRIR